MQWQGFVKSERQGIVAISVLLLASVFLTVIHGLMLAVHKEMEAQTNSIEQEQALNLGESLICIALEKESSGILGSKTQMGPIVLYPGGEEVRAELTVDEDQVLGVREIKASIEKSSGEWNVYQDKIFPPGSKENGVYQSTIYAQYGISGNVPGGIACNDGSSGLAMPQVNAAGYKKYGKLVLPTAIDLRDYGLRKRLYFNTSSGNIAYSIPYNTIIKGDGVFVDESGITFNRGCQSLGNLWLISGSGIVIGDNVKLDKSLIIAQKNISIGNNVSINGIIICGGKVTIGSNLIMTRDEKVLEPFSTVCYYL